MPWRRAGASAVAFGAVTSLAWGQAHPVPHAFRGVQTRIDGVFLTPVANAPFTATVEIVSHEKLLDGTEHIVTTRNHIARSSSGRIRNERRQLVTTGYKGEPRLLSVHLYDPSDRMSIYLDPVTRLARETVLPAPLAQRSPATAPGKPDLTEVDLGTQTMDSVPLQGTRQTRTISAETSGTGQAVQVTDEYWYSPDLSIYMIIKHNDPRTGEQIVAVSDVHRHEPPAEEMAVPSDYKVVDEAPPPRPTATGEPAISPSQP